MVQSDDIVDLERRLQIVRAKIERFKKDEIRLTRHIQIIRARPNIQKYLKKLNCRNIDTAQLRFRILEYVCDMDLGISTGKILENLRPIDPGITYGNIRVNLSRMSAAGLFEAKRRGKNWIASSHGKDILRLILDGSPLLPKEAIK